jgi:tetratricopeptide (TPR) repeat protein
MRIDELDLEALIERIVASGALGGGDRLPTLLRYVLAQEMAGQGDRLKAYSIAMDVFGRGSDFNPQSDSIVRVEIARLRKALEFYFVADGRDEPVTIAIAKGGYRPVLMMRSAAAADQTNPVGEDADILFQTKTDRTGHKVTRSARIVAMYVGGALLIGFLAGWLISRTGVDISRQPVSDERVDLAATGIVSALPVDTIGIMPFSLRAGSEAESTFALRLWNSLTANARSKMFRIYEFAEPGSKALTAMPPVLHVVAGNIVMTGEAADVAITLTNAVTKELVWKDTFTIDRPGDPEALLATTRLIIAELAPRALASAKRELLRRPKESLSATDLVLLSNWYPGFAENIFQWEQERVELASKALKTDPKFGLAHAVLADKLAYLANYMPAYDSEATRQQASSHATVAMQLASENPDVVFNVALHLWHTGQPDDAARWMRRVAVLNPGQVLSGFMAAAMPYTCRPVPEEVLAELGRIDNDFKQGNSVRWVTLGWLARLQLNNRNMEAALDLATRANDIFSTPEMSLLIAALLANSGDITRARSVLDQQLGGWPQLNVEHYRTAALPRRCTGPFGEWLADFYRGAVAAGR